MTPREKHVAEIERLQEAYSKSYSKRLKNDYAKAICRMKKELKLYDILRSQKE